MSMKTIDLTAIRSAKRSREPYDFLLSPCVLRADAIDDLRRDFPDIAKPGFLGVDEVELRGRFKTLIEELQSQELTEELSQRFGQDLHPYPRRVTIMKRSLSSDGAIQRDDRSNVLTMFVYLTDEKAISEGGRLRVLYDAEHFEPYALEVPPVMGTAFAFLRAYNSWNGHKPFSGERRVVQIAWVDRRAQTEHIPKHRAFTQFFKNNFLALKTG